MPCLFCQREFGEGDRKRTREHVFGNWTTPYLRHPNLPGTQTRWTATRDERQSNSFPAFPAQQSVQDVCQRCNSQRLSQIQTDAKPFLLHALKSPKARSFGEGAQEAMATWAYRAALMAGAKGRSQVPASHLHDFFEERKPPETARIWIAATGIRQFTYINHSIIKVFAEDDEPPPRANAFSSVLGIGHLAFCVVRWTDTMPGRSINVIDNGRFKKVTIPIWPVRQPIGWPPSKAFSQKGLDQLAGIFGSWDDK